jgi:hypothetical protein
MAVRAFYNSLEGIRKQLVTLDTFHEFIRARNHAYERGETLEEFCILGRWMALKTGLMCRISSADVLKIWPDIPDVVSREEFNRRVKNVLVTFQPRDDIPVTGERCCACECGWRVRNSWDYVRKTRPDGQKSIFHIRCRMRAEDAKQWRGVARRLSELGFEFLSEVTEGGCTTVRFSISPFSRSKYMPVWTLVVNHGDWPWIINGSYLPFALDDAFQEGAVEWSGKDMIAYNSDQCLACFKAVADTLRATLAKEQAAHPLN